MSAFVCVAGVCCWCVCRGGVAQSRHAGSRSAYGVRLPRQLTAQQVLARHVCLLAPKGQGSGAACLLLRLDACKDALSMV